MTHATSLQKLSFFLTAFGIACAPLAFGGTTSWFTPVLATYCGILALFRVIDGGKMPALHNTVARCFYGCTVLYFGVAAWCLLQAFPAAPMELVHDSWRAAGEISGLTARGAISVNPEQSVRGTSRLLSYGVVFLLCYWLAAREARAIGLLTVVVLSGAVYAIYGIVLQFTAADTVLWYPRTFEIGNLSSTFPNRNAFASFAILCMLGACALLYRRRVRSSDLAGPAALRIAAGVRYIVPRNWWIAASGILTFVAVLMTHSRGGLLVALAALVVFTVCAGRAAQFGRVAKAAGAGIVVIAVFTFFAGGGGTAKRFSMLSTAVTERIEIHALTIDAISDRPLLGTGLGTFSDIFPAYRTPSLRPEIEYAHNSYLENALEMGVPAALIFYAALLALFGLFARSLYSHRPAQPYPTLGLSTMVAIGLHAGFDHAVQFPAVAITASALLGIAAAQSLPRHGDDTVAGAVNEKRRETDS